MYWVRRFTYLFFTFLLLVFVVWVTPRVLDPTHHDTARKIRDSLWVSSSPYWWDRQACRWLSVCGLHHLRRDPASRGGSGDWDDDHEEWGELKRRALESPGYSETWSEKPSSAKTDKKRHAKERRKVLKDVPDYVLKHAPLVHLYSGEEFWPSDIREHVEHMTVYVDDAAVNATDGPKWTLHNLHELNDYGQVKILRSDDDVESRPPWLHSHANIPQSFVQQPSDSVPPRLAKPGGGIFTRPESSTWFDVDKSRPLHKISDPRVYDFPSHHREPVTQKLVSRGHKPDPDGYSSAPAILVVVDKGSGIVDAFWFFFYSYNLGQTVLGIRFGNHVGDWEHSMVRFQDGQPKGIFFSEHEGGQAYAWEAVEKYGDRPVIYSAVGSHAMYALPGQHPYILPFGLLRDVTDKGPIWDPALNNYAYHYDYALKVPSNDPDHSAPDEGGDDKDGELKEHQSRQEKKLHSKDYIDNSFVPASSNPDAPIGWFHFLGRWGDQVYSLADIRQWRLFGQYHYVTGPQGPIFKHLNRTLLCTKPKCKISYDLDPRGTWY